MFYDFFKLRQNTKIGEKIVYLLNKKIVSLIKKTFSPNDQSFLEIGTGKAVFATILKDEISSIKYTGIEPNKELSSQATIKGLKVINTRIPPLPKSLYNKFDIVYMSHVLEHFLNYQEVLYVLSELKKCLKRDGKLIILYPDWLDYKDEGYFTGDYTHSYILTEIRMQQILTDSGFRIIKNLSFRGCFKDNIFIFLFHLFIKFFADIMFFISKKEIFFKMKITFGRNILVIAEKK